MTTSAGPGGVPLVEGRRRDSRDGGWDVEAWGQNLAGCATQALLAVVECFAVVPDRPTVRLLPLSSATGGPEDALGSLLEKVIDDIDVLSLVPVRFHLGESEDGGLAGDMEAVSAEEAELVGPAPTSVSRHDLSVHREDGLWRCRARVLV